MDEMRWRPMGGSNVPEDFLDRDSREVQIRAGLDPEGPIPVQRPANPQRRWVVTRTWHVTAPTAIHALERTAVKGSTHWKVEVTEVTDWPESQLPTQNPSSPVKPPPGAIVQPDGTWH